MRFFLAIIIFVTFCETFEICRFDAGVCGWTLAQPWNVVGLALFGAKPEILTSAGPFLLAQGRFGGSKFGQAVSQNLPISENLQILTYNYQRKGDARLRVLLKNSTSEMLLDSIVEEVNTVDWARRSVVIPPVLEDSSKVIFEALNIDTSTDLLAIDDVELAAPKTTVLWMGKNREIRRKNPIISSSNNKIHRLTALQNLQFSPFEKLQYQPPTVPFLMFSTDAENEAVLPITPTHVTARGVAIF